GVLGMAMAFVYGLVLGALRVRARGMLAPFVAHVAIDLVVFALLVGTLGRQ
ncbi:MAG: CPBP family intramembrane metalloprotease, partial [Deltaproteobacteria bacterium]|nr:CPBP family intramembrane metalloprotease [Deltaproteobacteria bacterium]